MTMSDWIEALDNQITNLKRKMLEGSGSISHKKAIEKAEKEFETYRAREMKQLESDFDRATKQLLKKRIAKTKAECTFLSKTILCILSRILILLPRKQLRITILLSVSM